MPFWLILIILAVTTVATGLLARSMRPRGQERQPSALSDLTFPTAEEGRPIPVVFGTVKISAPNVVWYGDLSVQPIRRQGQTVGYKYHAGMQLALCHGPVEPPQSGDIKAGEDDKSIFFTSQTVNGAGGESFRQLTVNMPNLFGGDDKEGGITGRFDFYRGLTTQEASDYMVARVGSLAPPYHGLCHVVARRPYLGTTQYIKQLSWVVRRFPSALGLTSQQTNVTGDANPAEILYELITNPLYGLGRPASGMDTADFAAAGATLAAEGMGMSIQLDNKEAAQQVVDEILRHIDGVIYTDPETGLWRLTLARGDYDPYSLIEIGPEDLLETPELTRGSWAETLNEIKVEYTEAGTFQRRIEQAHEAANHATQGERITETIRLHGFTKAALAQRIATRELRAASFPLLKGTVKVNRKAWGFRIGGVFRLTSFAIGTVVQPSRAAVSALHARAANQTQSGVDWTALGDAKDLDAQYANSLIVYPVTESKRLELTNFLELRNVPNGVQIDGIEVPLRYNIPQGNATWKVQLLLNGSPVGDAKFLSVAQTTTDVTVIFGGPGDDWNCGLSPADFRDSSFGVAIVASDLLGVVDTEFNLDAAPLTVYYSRPAQIAVIPASSASSVNVLGSGVVWSDPANALVSDDSRATAVLGAGGAVSQSRTENLRLRFPAALPEAATVTRIALALERSQVDAPTRSVNQDNTIQLVSNGAAAGPDKAEVAAWPTTEGVKVYEWSGADLSGITPEALNAPDFSADVGAFSSFQGGSDVCTARVDAAELTVEWSLAVPASVVMRILPIRYGALEKGEISVDVVEDIFAHIEEPIFDNPAAGDSGWVDPIDPPIDPRLDGDGVLLQEVPFHLANSIEVLVAATRRDGTSDRYEVWSDEGYGFHQTNVLEQFTPTGVLTADYDRDSASLDTTGFTVEDGIDLERLVSTDAAGRIRGDNLLVIGDEWMSWQTVTDNGDGTFTLTGIVRGIFDTHPKDHAAGDMVYFVSAGSGLNRTTPYLQTGDVDVKALPRNALGVLAIGDTSAVSLTLSGRADKPYPPGNMRINGALFPTGITGDAVITWAHRNRFTLKSANRVAQQDEGNVGSAEGTYTVEILMDMVVVRTVTGITGTTHTYTQAQRNADDPTGNKLVTVRIIDVRPTAAPPDVPSGDSPPEWPGGQDLVQL